MPHSSGHGDHILPFHARQPVLNVLLLRKKGILFFPDNLCHENAFGVCVNEPGDLGRDLIELQLETFQVLVLGASQVVQELFEPSSEESLLRFRKAYGSELGENCFFDHLFAEALPLRTAWHPAAVIRMAFLDFSAQVPRTDFASDEPAKHEEMMFGVDHGLAAQNLLHPIEQNLRDQRLVHSRENEVHSLHGNESHVEAVIQDAGHAVPGQFCSPAVPQASAIHLLDQALQAVIARGVELEGLAYQRSSNRIRLLDAFAAIEISDGSPARVTALLQARQNPFLGFFAEIPDEIRGYYRLDVSREPAAARAEVVVLVRKVNIHAGVDEFAKIRPVL